MIKIETIADTALYNAIFRTIVELDNMNVLLGERCCVCNYEGICDVNDRCTEGVAEYIYNTIKGVNK